MLAQTSQLYSQSHKNVHVHRLLKSNLHTNLVFVLQKSQKYNILRPLKSTVSQTNLNDYIPEATKHTYHQDSESDTETDLEFVLLRSQYIHISRLMNQ